MVVLHNGGLALLLDLAWPGRWALFLEAGCPAGLSSTWRGR